jgi:hypothetical protein
MQCAVNLILKQHRAKGCLNLSYGILSGKSDIQDNADKANPDRAHPPSADPSERLQPGEYVRMASAGGQVS